MTDATDNKMLKVAEETLSWGRDVSEMWNGTLYQRQIDLQVEAVQVSLEHKDIPKIRALVSTLATFLDNAEREYNEH